MIENCFICFHSQLVDVKIKNKDTVFCKYVNGLVLVHKNGSCIGFKNKRE